MIRCLLVVVLAVMSAAAVPPVKRGPVITGAAPKASVKVPPRTPPKKQPSKSVLPVSSRPVPPAAGKGPMAPYRGAIAVDADTGRILFGDHETRTGYPASCTKLMTFLLVLEDLRDRKYKLTDVISSSHYAASQEPSRVDFPVGKTMTINDLLYALMLRSANNAAVALAEHSAWIRSGKSGPPPQELKPGDLTLVNAFVTRMNRRAQELGMSSSRYASPNGLPPPAGSKRGFDTSTAADLSILARTLVKMPEALVYTREATRRITDGTGKVDTLVNHNYFVAKNQDPKNLCTPLKECDGLKTGFTSASGSSIVLTAQRRGRRVVVVVLGSAGRHERERAAGCLIRDALDAVSLW